MKKIVLILLASLLIVFMVNLASADNLILTNQTQNSTNDSYQNMSDVKIFCNSSPWIDPISDNESKRTAKINYTIVGNWSGTIVLELSNKSSVYRLLPIVVSNGTGSFDWDGKIASNMVNQAGNPYYITLVLKNTDGVEVARSAPKRIFIGRPVLILHGIIQVAGDMEDTKLYKNLSKTHFTRSIEYMEPGEDSEILPGCGDIKHYGYVLGLRIRGIKQVTGAEEVDIIGYSMGGLVGRWYSQELLGSSSIGKLIMLGTPNHGAAIANIGPIELNSNYAKVQMKPHSEFIKWLNGYDACCCPDNYGETKFDSRGYITIAGYDYFTLDHVCGGCQWPRIRDGDMVVPYDSVRLPHVCNFAVASSHLDLPDNDDVVFRINTILDTRDSYYDITKHENT